LQVVAVEGLFVGVELACLQRRIRCDNAALVRGDQRWPLLRRPRARSPPAQRDAIAGAFLLSKNGAPTVRFIWGKLDHFFDHVERGRRRRLEIESAEQSCANPTPNARSRAVRASEPLVPREQMRLDIERILGRMTGYPSVAAHHGSRDVEHKHPPDVAPARVPIFRAGRAEAVDAASTRA
jgi:hypothetical protein